MKQTRINVEKQKSGKVVCTVIKDGGTMQLDVNECCLISDKVDMFLFGKSTRDRRVSKIIANNNIPPMSKEEMHDLLYKYDYRDGTSFTKAMSVKMARMIDEGKVKTFGDMFTLYHNVLADPRTVKV